MSGRRIIKDARRNDSFSRPPTLLAINAECIDVRGVELAADTRVLGNATPSPHLKATYYIQVDLVHDNISYRQGSRERS